MRILVTAGPTQEYFDSVRFISNASSGKMGFAIATEAAARGHDVILVTGPVCLPDPSVMEVVRVTSADEMFEAVTTRFSQCDAAVLTAAVCDYKPSRCLPHKLKKQDGGLKVELQPNRDICAHLGEIKGRRILVGFALEDHNHHLHAEAKLRQKQCDAIVLNSVDTLGADRAGIEIFRADKGWSAPLSTEKTALAAVVLTLLESMFVAQSGCD